MNGASVGLAITQSMALTMMLQWGIRQSAEVMNQMMAVERVLEYRELGMNNCKRPIEIFYKYNVLNQNLNKRK